MGTFAALFHKAGAGIPDEKREEFRVRMDKLFQMGGMMEMEQVQLCNILDQKDASERMKEAQDMWGFFKKGRHDVYISDIVVYETNECRMENVKF